MEEPLISVIVPVYNVERYLAKSIGSIIGQSYHNLEIILIDDGSTDSSGEICNDFLAKDTRIKVLHQKNMGQGAARNRGLDICTGKYIYFHDSDDWIDEDCIQYLFGLIQKSNSHISACNYRFVDESGIYQGLFSTNSKNCLYNGFEVIKHMWNDEIINIAPWGKLFDANLWSDFRFKECYCEDSATMYLLYSKEIILSYGCEPKVNYNLRQSSDVRSFSDKKIEMLDIYDEIVEYAQKHLPIELQKAAISKQIAVNFHVLSQLPSHPKYSVVKARIKKTIKKSRLKVIINNEARSKNRIACIISYFGIDLVLWLQSKCK